MIYVRPSLVDRRLFQHQQQRTKATMETKSASPPSTPPTMMPTAELLLLPPVPSLSWPVLEGSCTPDVDVWGDELVAVAVVLVAASMMNWGKSFMVTMVDCDRQRYCDRTADPVQR